MSYCVNDNAMNGSGVVVTQSTVDARSKSKPDVAAVQAASTDPSK